MKIYYLQAIRDPLGADFRALIESEPVAEAALFVITVSSKLQSNLLYSRNRKILQRVSLPKICRTFDSNFSLGKIMFCSPAQERLKNR